MKKRGFSLAELLTVVVIVGVLAAIAMPQFSRTVEQARADQAVTYLKLIRSGEKVYYVSNGDYVGCNATEIQSVLNVELTTENFNFSVANSTGTFTATATRKNQGNCKGLTITLDQGGVFNGTYQTGAGSECQRYFDHATKVQ